MEKEWKSKFSVKDSLQYMSSLSIKISTQFETKAKELEEVTSFYPESFLNAARQFEAYVNKEVDNPCKYEGKQRLLDLKLSEFCSGVEKKGHRVVANSDCDVTRSFDDLTTRITDGVILGGVFGGNYMFTLISQLRAIYQYIGYCERDVVRKTENRVDWGLVVLQCNELRAFVQVYMDRYAIGYVEMIIWALRRFTRDGNAANIVTSSHFFHSPYAFMSHFKECCSPLPDCVQQRLADAVESCVAASFPRLTLSGVESLASDVSKRSSTPKDDEWDVTKCAVPVDHMPGHGLGPYYHSQIVKGCCTLLKLVFRINFHQGATPTINKQYLRLLRAYLFFLVKYNYTFYTAGLIPYIKPLLVSTISDLVRLFASKDSRCAKGELAFPSAVELLLLLVNNPFSSDREKLFPGARAVFIPEVAKTAAKLLACIPPAEWVREHKVLLHNLKPREQTNRRTYYRIWMVRGRENRAKEAEYNAHRPFTTVHSLVTYLEAEARKGEVKYKKSKLGFLRRVANHQKMLELYILGHILTSRCSTRLCEDVINVVAEFLFGWGYVVAPKNFFKNFRHLVPTN